MSTASNPSPLVISATDRRKFLGAVSAHDARMDGMFVYGVRSTGIYCRPSCPSRRPRPDQIELFGHPEAAEEAGFRACRRCRPREASGNPRSQLVSKACQAIERHLDGVLSLRHLAELTRMSPAHLQRTFRRAVGISPRQYADSIRSARFKSELRKGKDVTTALHEVNYGSASRLYEKSDERLGMTPATYRRGGLGMNISYTIAPCALGRVLVAATERGVSAVYLGDRETELTAALRKEYPNASIRRDSEAHSRWVSAIVRNITGANPGLDLPTDVIATAFQRRVWDALCAIPSGTTRTYSQVAREIGSPKAVRAVGHACATNPAAIVVPCHRVVREDGSLGGYRWGLDRKKKLIEQERASAKSTRAASA